MMLSKETIDTLFIFESVMDDSRNAKKRLESLEDGTADTTRGLDKQGVLRLYREKLQQAIADLDKLIED